MKHNSSFNTTKKGFEIKYNSTHIWNLSVKCSVTCLCLTTLSMLSHSNINYWGRYRYVIAQTEPRARISCFNPSHHRAGHGISLLRTSADFSAMILSHRGGTSHWLEIFRKESTDLKNTFCYLASHRQNHVTSHFSTAHRPNFSFKVASIQEHWLKLSLRNT